MPILYFEEGYGYILPVTYQATIHDACHVTFYSCYIQRPTSVIVNTGLLLTMTVNFLQFNEWLVIFKNTPQKMVSDKFMNYNLLKYNFQKTLLKSQ
jgi:hypothetical protein